MALWNCGCVLSERALKEVTSSVCHKVCAILFCTKAYQIWQHLTMLKGKKNMSQDSHNNLTSWLCPLSMVLFEPLGVNCTKCSNSLVCDAMLKLIVRSIIVRIFM